MPAGMARLPLLAACCACLWLTSAAAPMFPRQRKLVDGVKTVMCNAYKKCPQGFACMPDADAPGNKACYLWVKNVGEPRPGRCPPVEQATLGWWGHTLLCDFHVDCNPGERCCPSPGKVRRCTVAVAVDDSRPRVTVIVPGQSMDVAVGDPANTIPLDQDGRQVTGTITLIQSKGRNVLFDTGTPGAKIELLDALEREGLTLEDIGHVEMSHGHPDHCGNIGMFDDIDGGVGQFDRDWFGKKRIIRFPHGSGGDVYGAAPGDSQYRVFNDTDLLVVKANGHTVQDTSLVVSNVPELGTVIVTGDLFLDENDYVDDAYYATAEDPEQARKSRRWAVCMADYIVPGHGSMFRPTDALKESVGGCPSVLA